MVLARNTVSGQIADIPAKMLEHPAFRDVLEEVSPEAKPYVPALYKPKRRKGNALVPIEAEVSDVKPEPETDTEDKEDLNV
jgi:hypothetical protein